MYEVSRSFGLRKDVVLRLRSIANVVSVPRSCSECFVEVGKMEKSMASLRRVEQRPRWFQSQIWTFLSRNETGSKGPALETKRACSRVIDSPLSFISFLICIRARSWPDFSFFRVSCLKLFARKAKLPDNAYHHLC